MVMKELNLARVRLLCVFNFNNPSFDYKAQNTFNIVESVISHVKLKTRNQCKQY